MKKKFDFSAEIESTEARTNQEYRKRYEEENILLKVNADELMKLNDNIHEMRTVLEKLANAVNITMSPYPCAMSNPLPIMTSLFIIISYKD